MTEFWVTDRQFSLHIDIDVLLVMVCMRIPMSGSTEQTSLDKSVSTLFTDHHVYPAFWKLEEAREAI